MVKYLVTTPCPAPRPRWSRSSKTRYRTTLRSRYRSSPGPLAPPPSRISSRNLPRNQQGNCILELIFTLYNMGHVVRSIRERERKKRNKKKRRRSSWNKQRRKSFSFAVRKKKERKIGSPATFFLYSSGLCRYMAAASPFKGSIGLGYVNNWGRKDSNIFDKSETTKSREKRLIAWLVDRNRATIYFLREGVV